MTSDIKIDSLADGLVLYLPFNGNAKDESGNGYVTTVYGATLALDRFGNANQAYYFDGNSKIGIQYQSDLDIGTKDVTFMAWVKFNTLVTSQRIIDNGSSGCSANPGYMFRTNGNKILQEKTCNSGSGCEISSNSNANLVSGQWYHIVTIIQNGQNSKIYINGVLDKETSDPSPGCNLSSGDSVFLGYNQYLNAEFLYGYLDEIAIWHKALTAIEVQQLYAGASLRTPTLFPTVIPTKIPTDHPISTLKNGLVAYYPFNGNANDESGNGNHGITNNVELTTDRFGNPLSAYYFNGNAYIKTVKGEQFNFINEFSLSYWIKPSESQVEFAAHFDKSHYVGASWTIQKAAGYSNSYYIGFRQPEGWSNAAGSMYNIPCIPNEWNHIVITKHDNEIKYYRDGALKTTEFVINSAIITNGDLPLFIGAVNNNVIARYFKGTMDEIAIWHKALTAIEVQQLYAGVPIKTPTTAPTLEPTFFPSKNPLSLRTPTLPPTVTPTKIPTYHPTSTLKNGLVAYFPFNGNANDESGNGNHGVVHSAVLSADRFGKPLSGYTFNVNAYIEINGFSFEFKNQFSISMWIKPASSQVTYSIILDKSHNSYVGYNLQQDGSVTNSFCPGYYYQSGYGKHSCIQLVANNWNHLVFSKQDTIASYYLNGVLMGTTTAPSTGVITDAGLPLLIGAWNSGHTSPASSVTRYYNGAIDDIYIYNRALSSAEVQQLYSYDSPTPVPTKFPIMQPTDYIGISTLREGQVPNKCFEAQVSFNVVGKSESLRYITTEQSSSYDYVSSDRYTGSTYFGALKFANIALKSSASYSNFKAVSASSYSTTIGVVHILPISFINPTLNSLGEAIYKSNSPEDFKFRCGDKIIDNSESFITVTATFNYIFKSRDDAYKFQNDVDVSGALNNWLIKGSVKNSDSDYFSKYSGYLSLTIEQFGGEPASFLKAMGNTNTLGFCRLSEIKNCAEIMVKVNTYIKSQQFAEQLDHSRWDSRLIANLETSPISTIPGIDIHNYPSDYISNSLSKTRLDLVNKLTQVTSDYNYIQGLQALITGENCETTATYSNAFIHEVENVVAIIKNYLQTLTDTNSGIPACYSDYKNCVDAIAPRLLNLAYNYSEIVLSQSICVPVECKSPGTAEIGIDGFEQYDDWYLNSFFTSSNHCYYGCLVTNEYCSIENEIVASNGNALNSNIELLAGAAIVSLAVLL